MNPVPSSKGCPQEASVSKATRTGQWDNALEEHAATCPVCSEVALISDSLRTIALETEDHKSLPDPYLVWLKAKLAERQAASHRVSKRWDLAEALSQCVAAVVLAGWLWAEWPSIYQRLAEWMPASALGDWSLAWSLLSPSTGFPPSLVFWTVIGLVCFVTLMVVQPLFAED